MLLGYLPPQSSTLEMEAAYFFKMLVCCYPTTSCHISETTILIFIAVRTSHFIVRFFCLLIKFKILTVLLIFQCVVAATLSTYAFTSCPVYYTVLYNSF
jgi:hypothetical protein